MEIFQQTEGWPTPSFLEGASAGLETIIKIEDLRVDVLKGTVCIGQDDIPVTAVEFRILCALMMQPAAVIRRAALLTAIRERHPRGTSRSLDVHISRLRTKLRTYGGWIRTVKGVGYRFFPTAAAETPSTPREFRDVVNS